jgi:hypothetical protein
VQGAAFALETGSVQCGLLRLGKQCADVRGGGVEMAPAQGEGLAAAAVGEQSEVADLHKACGQDMEQETPDELDSVEVHNGTAVVMPGVSLGCSGVESRAFGAGFGEDAGPLIVSADKQMAAFLVGGKNATPRFLPSARSTGFICTNTLGTNLQMTNEAPVP